MKLSILISALLVCGCSTAPAQPDAEREGCHTPLGFIPEGHTATGYLHQVEAHGQHCQPGVLTCESGVWAGAYIYPTCVMSP